MIVTRRAVAIGALGTFGSAIGGGVHADFGEWFGGLGEGLEDFWTATDAYIYGYPLVTMEMTRRVMTNVAAPEGTHAPMGQLVRLREYPDASFRDVTAPNADTLYTTAWIDVGDEPWVLSLPDMHGRYALFPMLDGWTNVFEVPGKRTTGTGAQTYVITGPRWSGDAARRRRALQVANRAGLAPRPHLLHRHARGLRRRARAPGRSEARAAERLRQGLSRRPRARSTRRST